jgi:hypothetical protein
MRFRASSWLAWALAGLSVAIFVAGVGLTLLSLSGAADTRPSSTSWGTVGGLLVVVPYLAFPLVGALIASKRPHNPIGWICLTAGLFWMLILSGPVGSVPYPVTSAALTQGLWVPPVGLLGIYMILLFPDGKLPSKRWRPLAWFSGALIAVICVGFIFVPGPLEGYPGVRNPFGLEGQPWVSAAVYVLLPLLPLCMLASALSLVWRYRHAGGEVREQIKWVAFAASLVAAGYLIILISGLFFPPEASAAWRTSLEALEEIMVQLSFAGIPVAIGFSVLKYRLYDIDLLINRALVYGPLTILLAATYFGGVVGLQRLFSPIVGGDSGLATVATTLAIAALFNPLGRRVQAFVDRCFYRSKYDAAKILEAFGSRLQNETDVDVLRNDVVEVARTTMQPAHVSLWLRPDPGPKARSAALRQFGHDG